MRSCGRPPGAIVVPATLDPFCQAFNARDLERVTALLLDTAVVEFPGLAIEYGAEAARTGSLAGVLFGPPSQAIAPQFRAGLTDEAPRLELRVHRGYSAGSPTRTGKPCGRSRA